MSDEQPDQLRLLATEVADGVTAPRLAAIPSAKPYLSQGITMATEDDAERPFWVAWNRVRGIGPARFARVIEVFGSAQAGWEAPLGDLGATGFDAKLVEAIGRQRLKIAPEREMERLARSAVAALTLRDNDYPRLLREIPLPPAVLYVRGMLLPQDEIALAIVGTRRISAYGRQVTQRLATELVGRGLTIVSGLARGVDAVAHTAALEANGRTIKVLGCGPDLVYPPEHAKLAERIAAQGAVVSEFAAGMPPEAGNFPARNRIISGLSLATLLTEAPEGSGALITANFATEQGRDVLAVPGNITQRTSAGCNMLIKNGAACITSAEDVADALNLHLVPQQLDMRALLPEDPTEARILALLSEEPRHADEICQLAALPTATVTSTLMMLELKGMARHLGNMMYVTA
jgi:DNA processing protein